MRTRRRVALALLGLVVLGLGTMRLAIQRQMRIHPLGSTLAGYGYVELVPEAPGPRPLLLLLHGSGSRGDGRHPSSLAGLPPLRDAALARLMGRRSPLLDEGVLIVAPQSPTEWDVAGIDAFLDHILATHDVDRARIYVTGMSMGGCGTWRYAAAHPERLAAALPICGGCPAPAEGAGRLDSLPVRAFHAFDDDVVPNYESATWAAAIGTRRGGDGANIMVSYPEGTDSTAVFDGKRFAWRPGTGVSASETLTLTEFAHGGHGIWKGVYANDATWRWLLAQRRQ